MTDEMEIARKVQGNLRRTGVKSEITVTIGLVRQIRGAQTFGNDYKQKKE